MRELRPMHKPRIQVGYEKRACLSKLALQKISSIINLIYRTQQCPRLSNFTLRHRLHQLWLWPTALLRSVCLRVASAARAVGTRRCSCAHSTPANCHNEVSWWEMTESSTRCRKCDRRRILTGTPFRWCPLRSVPSTSPCLCSTSATCPVSRMIFDLWSVNRNEPIWYRDLFIKTRKRVYYHHQPQRGSFLVQTVKLISSDIVGTGRWMILTITQIYLWSLSSSSHSIAAQATGQAREELGHCDCWILLDGTILEDARARESHPPLWIHRPGS